MPQLNPAFFSMQIFWVAVTFILLLVLMSKVALPKIASILDERSARIDGDIAAAKAARDAAEALFAATEKSLLAARASAQDVMKVAQETADAEAKRREHELAQRLSSEASAAEARITAAKQSALENVRQIATEVAAAATSKLIGTEVSEADAAGAIDQTLRERA